MRGQIYYVATIGYASTGDVGDCLSPKHLAVDENAIDCGYLIRLFCSENLNHFANIFLAFQHKAMYALGYEHVLSRHYYASLTGAKH